MGPIPLGHIPAWYADRLGGDRPALVHGHETVSWSELDRRSTRRAWALRDAGVGADDLVTLALPNGSTLYELTFALWKLGATPHIVSDRLPKPELAAILETARPRLLVTSKPNFVEELGGRDPATLVRDSQARLSSVVARYWKAGSSGGSTGRPKVVIDHMRGEIDPDVERLRIPQRSCIVNPGPLYHHVPFSWSHYSLFRGSTVVGMLKFDPEETLRLVERHQGTWIVMVPTMMLRIWRLPSPVRNRYDLSSLRTVWHVAAPMTPWLKQAWIDWLGPERIWELYSGTERPGYTTLSGTEWLAHRGSVGRAQACELCILGEDGERLPPGAIGEIYLRPEAGPGTMSHCLGAEPRRTDDGFESLGDFGWLDVDGYLYLADRRTDLIVRGGANIYPAEVERALMEHSAVEQAVAIGLPDEDLGEIVHAIIQPRPGATPNIGELEAFARERLASYKIPRSFEITRDALRDDAGKVRRSQLRAARRPV